MERPYVTIKFAETLDGKIAAKDASSRWVSGPEARKFAHRLRARNDAVLVGIGTVLADDPGLAVRLAKGKNPARIILDRKLRIPLDSKIVKSAGRVRTIIVAARGASKIKAEKLKKKGVELLFNESADVALAALHKRGIRRILVEGGKNVITGLLKAGLADEVVAVVSPKVLGAGVESVGDLGIRAIKDALKLRLISAKRAGEDIIIRYETRKRANK